MPSSVLGKKKTTLDKTKFLFTWDTNNKQINIGSYIQCQTEYNLNERSGPGLLLF